MLSKATFSKIVGVEPLLIKGFLKILPQLLNGIVSRSTKDFDEIVINIVKTLGIYYSLASLIPNKMSSLYKNIIEIEYLQSIVSLVRSPNLPV